MSGSLAAGSLEALLESAQLLHGSLQLEELLRSLLRSVMGRLVVSRGLLALVDADGGGARVAVSRGFKTLPAGHAFDPTAASDHGVEHLLVIGDGNSPVGYLGLGRPLTGPPGKAETEFLQALLGIAAGAIDNARAHERVRRLNLQLDRRVQQLRTLLELVRSLTSTLDPERIGQILGLTLSGQWLVRRYAVHAWREGHEAVERQLGMAFEAPEELSQELAALGTPARVEELPEEGLLRQRLEANRARLVVPLVSADHGLGFVALGAPAGDRAYEDDDLTFAAGLAVQAAVAFENAWYFAETLRRETLERDLRLAGEIQLKLFPAVLPQPPGWQLAARNRPASEVGGDYYDALPASPPAASAGSGASSPYLLCIADVSGKGMAAALLMSNLQASLRALLGTGSELEKLVTQTNDLIHASSPSNKFITAFFVLLDPESGVCRYVNAGHNEGFVVRSDGALEALPPGGMPLGLFPGGTYQPGELTLEAGDLLVLYTDGVNEANNAEGEEWGDERMQEAIAGHAGDSAQEVVDGLFGEVDRFAAGAPQYDDITMLVVQRVGAS
ncbi:MAG: SpoIIE family protein phosphatase [Acidobacteriota bacterium]|nr:SpoIIE family protein phosphatase [Acidobacteriota bacterium]